MEKGNIIIADEVITVIAGLAAMETDGVHSVKGGWKGEIVSMIGKKGLSKGVKIELDDNEIYVSLSLNIKYGYSIPEVVKQVQERVASQIEIMTGMSVVEVNVSVESVVSA